MRTKRFFILLITLLLVKTVYSQSYSELSTEYPTIIDECETINVPLNTLASFDELWGWSISGPGKIKCVEKTWFGEKFLEITGVKEGWVYIRVENKEFYYIFDQMHSKSHFDDYEIYVGGKCRLSQRNIQMQVGDVKSLGISIYPTELSKYIKNIIIGDGMGKIIKDEGNGQVRAVGFGWSQTAAQVYFKGGHCMYSDPCSILVLPEKPVKKIYLSPTSLGFHKLGEQQSITAIVDPQDASIPSIEWISSNEDVATVDQSGTVTSVSSGKATIMAKATDGSGTKANCSVTVDIKEEEEDIYMNIYPTDVFGTSRGYTFTTEIGSAQSAPIYNNTYGLQIYKGGKMTINGLGTMSNIIFHLSNSMPLITADVGTIENDPSDNSKVIWTGSASTVTFTVESSNAFCFKYFSVANSEMETNGEEYYLIDDGHAWLCSISPSTEAIEIPEAIAIRDGNEIRVHAVIGICADACRDVKEKFSLVLPGNIISIGPRAFKNCGVKQLELKRTHIERIEDETFMNCSLSSVSIPASVTSIGDNAFAGCLGLRDIYCYAENIPSTGDNTFYNTWSASLHVPAVSFNAYLETEPWCNFTYIHPIADDDAIIDFADVNVKAICVTYWDTNGDGELSKKEAAAVTYLGKIFKENADITSFNELKYFTGLTYIGNYEFYRCSSLTSITIPITVKEIGEYAFYECSSLTSITIPKSVTSIGKTAFSDCSSLTSVTIPKSVTKIESLTFERCTSLTGITIPEGVTSIGYAAFTGCNQLTSVTIPESVTSIDEQAFNGCSSLKYVVVNIKTPLSIHSSTFEGCEKATLFVPTGCKSAYESATYWKNFKNILEIDDSIIIPFADANVKAICVAKWDTNGDGELSEKEAAAVTGLGSIFSKNAGITSFDELRFFTGLTSVGDSEFYRCSCLTSITIPEGVTSIGGYAFKDCSSLTSITIPEGVTSIGRSAFSGCSNLTSINIPTSVTSIYDYAFSNLSNLASIVIKEGNVKYDSRENCNAIIETSTNTLIAGCKSTIIPESVTKIGDYAFRGCSGLTSIVLPEGVTTIGNFAFYDCGNLESIAIPNSVTRIFGWLLDDCGSLRNIYCYAEQIPYAIGESFKNLDLESVILHVPAASLDAYKTTSPWNYFRNIVAIGYEIYATNINLDQTEYALTAEGETVQLNAIIAPDDATFKDVTWTSSDESVATVDGNGLVTAVGDGVAIITATTTDGTDLCTSCMVYVNIAVYATDIYLDQTKYALTAEGETAQLDATIAPDDATFKDVMWTSFDESVATVDENGLVTAVGNGVAIITATTVDGTDLIASCTVYVSIPIENNMPDVTGKTFTLRCERGYVGYDGSTLCSTTQEAASEFAIVDYGTTNYLYDVTNKAFVIHSTAAMAGDMGNRSLESSTYFAAAVTGLTWGKTGFETYPWYLEDSFTNWMNMDGELKVCMNTWKEFEGGNGGNTYQVEIVNENFDATEAIQMLDNYFQTAVEVTDEQYQAALNSVGTDTQYAIYTLKGGTRYYLTSEGYLTAEPSKDCVLTFARTEGDGLFRSPGWKVDACFTNPHLSEEGGASGALLPQGHILTDPQGRDDWDGQVWYSGNNGCYAVRATNAVSDTWGANTYWTVLDTNGDGVPEADYSWAPAFVWLLESDVESVGIRGIDNGPCNESGAWYTLDGRKLNAQPATKGIYIRNNQKVLLK